MSSLLTLLADASSTISGGAGQACAGSCNVITINRAFRNLANTLTFVVGAVSVIMIIIGGLRYVLSRGDQKVVQEAKTTLLYAVMGVVVAVVAFALISFVNSSVGKAN